MDLGRSPPPRQASRFDEFSTRSPLFGFFAVLCAWARLWPAGDGHLVAMRYMTFRSVPWVQWTRHVDATHCSQV
jgi:hypothetical protein